MKKYNVQRRKLRNIRTLKINKKSNLKTKPHFHNTKKIYRLKYDFSKIHPASILWK